MAEESKPKQLDGYDDFMSHVLEQLFTNRENHTDSADRDLDYMFKIGAEQLGQLGKALADGDAEASKKEVGHVAAILFEIFIRL